MTEKDYLERYYKGNIDDAIKRLDNGEPVQYIVGNVNFYGYIFEVNKNVLIPRFETEELVSKTINLINRYFDEKVSILDIGTGSGCIAITLKKELNANVTGVDISIDALFVAKQNAKNNDADVNFIKSNMLNDVDDKYDVIISNPPYIDKDEPIMDIVYNNEPHIALFAPNKGLYYYEEILKNASKNLNKKSIIAFEIGYLQGKKIIDIAYKYFPESTILLEQDMSLKDRFIFILNNV